MAHKIYQNLEQQRYPISYIPVSGNNPPAFPPPTQGSRCSLTLAGVFALLAGGEAGAPPPAFRLESMLAEPENREAGDNMTSRTHRRGYVKT